MVVQFVFLFLVHTIFPETSMQKQKWVSKAVNVIYHFHLMSHRPYWCTKQWSGSHAGVPKIQQELNSFLMLKLSFVLRDLRSHWSWEWKQSIVKTISYGLHSYCPKKRHQNVQNSSGTMSCRWAVSLQSFEYFDVISLDNKSIDCGTFLSICWFFFYRMWKAMTVTHLNIVSCKIDK